jgi:hypothetical protein
MKRSAALLITIVLTALATEPAGAYLKLGTRASGGTVNLRWTDLPVRYFITDAAGGGLSATDLRDATGRAFATWAAVETSDAAGEFVGFTAASPFDDDGLTVIGFANRPEQERTLGATSFLVDVSTGEIVESEIFFNTTFNWSVSGTGQSGRFDLESIALHEVGHLFGLGHSALGETELVSGGRRVIAAESVMFPIAFSSGNVEGRTLRPDDIAGISDIYPANDFRQQRGSVSGRITKNGTGVLGAHVIAFNPRTGRIVGGFTLNQDGRFTIAGLDQGIHVIRVEPLDDGDIESFFDRTLNIDVNFRVKFHDRLVAVPRGGTATGVEIRVEPK